MVARLTRAMLAVTLVSSALTAGATGLIAYRLLLAGEDRRLHDAAVDLVEESAGMSATEAEAAAHEEQWELSAFGIDIALFDGSEWLGGTPGLPIHTGCGWSQRPGESGVRLCGVPGHGRLAVARERLESIPLLRLTLPLARWAARPLTELSEALSRIEPGGPLPAPLHTPARYGEVNAVRGALVDLLTRLHEALDQSRRFAANAAHELRTPLTTLRAELELQSETPQPPDTARALERMLRTVTSLGVLVERLLVLADGTRGGLELSEPVSLSDLVEDVVLALPEEERHRVEVDAGTRGVIPGDGQLLRQLVDNVVENALKFSNGGRVRVSLQQVGDATLVDVRDEGPGIAPEDSMRVFEPFYRAPSARAGKQGHGIGLSLVALVARAHRAHAEFIPSPRGAHLRLSFPRATGPGC